MDGRGRRRKARRDPEVEEYCREKEIERLMRPPERAGPALRGTGAGRRARWRSTEAD